MAAGGRESPLLTASEALKKGLLESLEGPASEEASWAELEVAAQDARAAGDEVGGWTKVLSREFKQTKRHYYDSKMNYNNITKEELHEQAVGYVRAIQWNLHYYYHGCSSWNWFYPHHFAPYISDIRGFADLKLEFELSEPFLPFQQLLAVLPAASKSLLPAPYQELMVDSSSPIIDFYPENFTTDLNGKKNDWEAVVLIPFINEDRLLAAMALKTPRLSKEEAGRNSHGPHLHFSTLPTPDGPKLSSTLPNFPDILHSKAQRVEIHKNEFRIPKEKVVYGLLPGVRDTFFPGFPTFHHLPFTFELRKAEVRVFQSNSRSENTILTVSERPETKGTLFELWKGLRGKEVHISWPHLVRAKIVAISNKNERLEIDRLTGKDRNVPLKPPESKEFTKESESIKYALLSRRGISIKQPDTVCSVRLLLGCRMTADREGFMRSELQWAETPIPVPLSTLVLNVKEEAGLMGRAYETLADAFPVDSFVFLLSQDNYYGCRAQVVENAVVKGRVKVRAELPPEPDLSRIAESESRLGLHWYQGHVAARRLAITSHFLSRITGTIYVVEGSREASSQDDGKHNVGLNLKSSKKGEEVADYTRREDGDSGKPQWLYSSKVLALVTEYHNKFPELFDYIQNVSTGDDIYHAPDIWGEAKGKQKVKEIADWLKSLDCYRAARQAVGTGTIDERVIGIIQSQIGELQAANSKLKRTKLAVKTTILYRPCLNQGNSVPDAKAVFELFDRVVNVREGSAVPSGLRGTVVGIHPGKSEIDTRLDIIFDSEFVGGTVIRNSGPCGARLPCSFLINLSHGQRVVKAKQEEEAEAEREKRRAEVAALGWPPDWRLPTPAPFRPPAPSIFRPTRPNHKPKDF